MIEYDNETVVQEFVDDVWNGHDPDAIERLATPECIVHQIVAGEDHDREAFRTFQARLLEAVPNFAVTIEDVVVDGDGAIAFVTMSGTPEKPMQALQPTGKSFSVNAFHKYRFEDGRVTELWIMVDALGTLKQLGLFPPTPRLLLGMAVGKVKNRLIGGR